MIALPRDFTFGCQRAILRLIILSTPIWLVAAQGQPPPLPAGTAAPDAQRDPAPAEPAKSSAQSPEVAKAEDAMEGRDLTAARTILERYLPKHPADPRALFDLGYIEDAQDHMEAAESDYRKAIAADPKQFESRLALALLLARADKLEEARQQLTTATTLEPASPNTAAQAQAFRTLARLDRTTDPSAAKAALLQALALSPESPNDALLTAEIAEASGDDETAEAAYHRVLNAQPGSSPAVAGLVHLLLKQKKYGEAEPILRSALLRDPDDPALNSQMASTLAAQGRTAEAITVLEKLRQLEPGDALIGRMLADGYTQTGNAPKAEPIYLALLKDSPRDADLLLSRGDNLIRQARYAEAVPVLQQAVQLKPDDEEGWSNLAFASSECRQYSITLQALSMRLKYAQDTPGTDFLWATAYDNLHQSKSAAEFYRRFLQAANGKFPDQEWQAKHRLIALERMH
ncbi:MAG TPA: tetratricopeptide repeat protein [Acidisarcina sp.]